MILKDTMQKYTFFQKIIILVFIFSLVVSLLLYVINNPGKRYVFLYESMDNNSLYTEEHWMKHLTPLKPEQFIAEELILGPKTDRYRPLFQYGTKILSCYKDGDTIIVNLSEDAAVQKGSASTTEDAWKLMQRNIKRLVKGVKNVTFFIAGHQVTKESFVKKMI